MGLLALSACGGDLLPGEVVLGDEREAVVVEGQAEAALGEAVAASGGRVLAGLPGVGEAWLLDQEGARLATLVGPAGFGAQVGFLGDRAWITIEEEALQWFDLSAEEPALVEEVALDGARTVAVCPDGRVLTRMGKGESVACTAAGQLETSCEAAEGCRVLLDGAEIGRTTEGAGLAFDGEIPCYGIPSLDTDPLPGEARCQDGRQVAGTEGDHLGVALAGARVAGVMDKWKAPGRARILPLDGGEIWAVDRAAERSRLSLAVDVDSGLFVVGVPGFGAREAREGRLFLVPADL